MINKKGAVSCSLLLEYTVFANVNLMPAILPTATQFVGVLFRVCLACKYVCNVLVTVQDSYYDEYSVHGVPFVSSLSLGIYYHVGGMSQDIF